MERFKRSILKWQKIETVQKAQEITMPATEQQKNKILHDLNMLKRHNPRKYLEIVNLLQDMAAGCVGRIDKRGNSTRSISHRGWQDDDFVKVLIELGERKKNEKESTKNEEIKFELQKETEVIDEQKEFIIIEGIEAEIVGRFDGKIDLKYENYLDPIIGDLSKTNAIKEKKQDCIDPYGLVLKKNEGISFEPKMRIAVITSAWKTQDYIEQFLDSIENSTMHPSIVLIGIDACQETRNSLNKILDSKKYSFEIKSFFSEENVGTYNIRNNLNDKAFNEYECEAIICMDSDDMFHCEYIHVAHDALLKNENCIVAPNIMFNFHHKDGKKHSMLNYCTAVNCFSKEIWKKIGYYLPIKAAADTEWIYRSLKLHQKIIVSNSLLYYRRMHEKQLTKIFPTVKKNPERIKANNVINSNQIVKPKLKVINFENKNFIEERKYHNWKKKDFDEVIKMLKSPNSIDAHKKEENVDLKSANEAIDEQKEFVIIEGIEAEIVGRFDGKVDFLHENYIDPIIGDLSKTEAIKNNKTNCIDPYGLVSKKQKNIFFEPKMNIAIIISAWRAQNYIEQLLDSIENNTMHPSIVLIGIDACKKTHDAIKIILNSKKYSFEIKSFFSEENVGTFNIRNNLNDLAFEKFESEAVINIDSDDMFHHQYIKAFHDLILNNKECVIAPCVLLNFFHSNGKIRSIQPYQCEVNCFSKEIWKKIGYYLPYRISSDREWLSRAKKLNVKIITNKSMFYYRRLHNDQLTHDAKSYNLDPQKIKSHEITYNNLILMPKLKKINLLEDNNHLQLNKISNKNIVLCSYLNHKEDPQRKIVWNDDYQKLIPLIESVTQKKC